MHKSEKSDGAICGAFSFTLPETSWRAQETIEEKNL